MGIGKMAVAYLAGARPDIVTQNGNLAKSNVDVRLYELKGPAGLWAGWFDFATTKGGTDLRPVSAFRRPMDMHSECVIKGLSGTAATTRFIAQYGTGAASNFSTSIDDPTRVSA